MLAESIIRIGRPIVESDLPNQERIRWLTDVDSDNCKNYFKNVFLVELDGDKATYHYLTIGNAEGKDFVVDQQRNNAYPILYPQGGNPIHAQGIYPVPCYLMYDPHIKQMKEAESFARGVVLPRLRNTVSYRGASEEQLAQIALRVAEVLSSHYDDFILQGEKQLGILYIFDYSLTVFHTKNEAKKDSRYLLITESKLKEEKYLYIDGTEALAGIIEAKFSEAKTLGYEKEAVSSFTNQREEEVASIYNKFWLWLSPTWEMPRSIYWGKKDWTRGIKIDRKSYEAYLYGTQFLKLITVPLRGALLKEMFSPVMNAEAKKHMRATSFEPIFGVPMVLPLLDGDTKQLYDKYLWILNQGRTKNSDGIREKSDSELHLALIAGIDQIVPKVSDAHRLTLLYYSGDLSRGNMHVRMVIEDVIPTVASKLEKIIHNINSRELLRIRRALGSESDQPFYRTQSLPAMLTNAYGPGYVWSSLQAAFHRQPIKVDRLYQGTANRLTELANKEEYWGMVEELIFHYAFLAFYDDYQREVVKREERVKKMSDWSQLLARYHQGEVTLEQMESAEELGFITGLLLKQFSHSYHHKTKKDFVKHRVMKFGSTLTPQMIWKYGVMRCEELAEQWEMGLAGNYYKILPHLLLGFLEADKKGLLQSDKDRFMTAFWSGYLMYQKVKEEE